MYLPLLLTILLAQSDNPSDFQSPNSGSAWVSLQSFGEEDYTGKTVPSIDFHGNLQLNGTTVTGDTTVSGEFSAKNSTLNNLMANGIVDLNGTTVTGLVIINGLIALHNSTISGDMVVTSDNVIIRSSKVQNLTIKPSGALSQVVTLSDGSQVNKISFEKAGGIVQIDSTSILADKNVINGSVQSD